MIIMERDFDIFQKFNGGKLREIRGMITAFLNKIVRFFSRG
jgi:hypothetical protein